MANKGIILRVFFFCNIDTYRWKTYTGFCIPYITRLVNGKCLKFVSTRIAEYIILEKYLQSVLSDIYTSRASVKGYVITDLEAMILNDINKKHYGMDFQFFEGKDYIVLLEEFFSIHYMLLTQN